VFLLESGTGPLAGAVLDVIRFNGDGSMIFYSDNLPAADAIGDAASPPTVFYANQLSLLEVGSEVFNGVFYTPTAGQPGYREASRLPITSSVMVLPRLSP
jgi:hypothetical protein